MGFSLNPFKKSSKNNLDVPKDSSLQPTKSTKSIAESIRSIGKTYENATECGQGPPTVYRSYDGETDNKVIPVVSPGIATGGGAGPAGLGGSLQQTIR